MTRLDVAMLERASLTRVPAPRTSFDGPFVLPAIAGGPGRPDAAFLLDPTLDPGLQARIAPTEIRRSRLA